jgi:hypothetical protein
MQMEQKIMAKRANEYLSQEGLGRFGCQTRPLTTIKTPLDLPSWGQSGLPSAYKTRNKIMLTISEGAAICRLLRNDTKNSVPERTKEDAIYEDDILPFPIRVLDLL